MLTADAKQSPGIAATSHRYIPHVYGYVTADDVSIDFVRDIELAVSL